MLLPIVFPPIWFQARLLTSEKRIAHRGADPEAEFPRRDSSLKTLQPAACEARSNNVALSGWLTFLPSSCTI
jgi:hypothetical protein